jgi:hypothetical protein
MEFEREYDEFGGKRDTPPANEECLMWSAGWTRGVRMLMEEWGMKLRGAKPGQGGPMGVEEHPASRTAIHAENRLMGRDIQSQE